MLIVDGHCSHAILCFKNLADDSRIILLFLPSHTMHMLQPLDVGIFGPLAQYYGQLVKDHICYGFDVLKQEYTEWILQACKKANSESNILSAFKKTGPVLFDPDFVLQNLKHSKKWPHRSANDNFKETDDWSQTPPG